MKTTQPTRRQKIVWTLASLLMLAGVYVLLFVGGLRADLWYNVYAASGTTPDLPSAAVPSITVLATPVPATPASITTEAPAPTADNRSAVPTAQPRQADVPVDTPPLDGQFSSVVPPAPVADAPSTITRIVIPKIAVDRKVIPALQIVDQGIATWTVDTYRVGHHQGLSNPGGNGNIVLSGHSGGAAYPFNDIFWLEAGDQIQLYSDGKIVEYVVSEHILVDEVGQSPEKRLENARYIGPTDEELITMVACWPLSGPDKFKQRIIIRATPTGIVSDAGAAAP